jgi:hypothetical protein
VLRSVVLKVDEPAVRVAGLMASVLYMGLIGWLFASQPKTMAEAIGGVAASVGAYRIDEEAFAEGLAFFRRDQFVESRAAFSRADPAVRDARTQFYLGYSFYRQGWHRTHHDDALYRQGLEAVDRAIALAGARLAVDDPNLSMHTADELKAELEAGLRTEASDFNPLRMFEDRK